MDYLIVFAGGVAVGVLLALTWGVQTKLGAIRQLRKDLKLPEEEPPIGYRGTVHGMTPEYKKALKGSMWGPRKGDGK